LFQRAKHPIEQELSTDPDELRKRLLGSRALDSDEARKRLLDPGAFSAAPGPRPIQQQSEHSVEASERRSRPLDDSVSVGNPSPSELGAKANTLNGGDPMSQVDPPLGTAAVAKVFEPTNVFHARLAKLVPAFDEVDRLAKEAITAFELVSELADHLTQFAKAYAPVKAFHGDVTVLAKKFDPLKGIQNQLVEMSHSFHDHLKYLADTLEPAGKLQERLAQLARAFEPAIELKLRFQELAREFEGLGRPLASGSAVNEAAGELQEAVNATGLNT
jgi:hypothetical protein